MKLNLQLLSHPDQKYSLLNMLSSNFLLTLLLTLSRAEANPDCTHSPPPSSLIPSLHNRLSLISTIESIARLQKNRCNYGHAPIPTITAYACQRHSFCPALVTIATF